MSSKSDKNNKKNLAATAAEITKPKAAYIPVAALKRFATELETDAQSNKFLQINRERVREFIEKPPADYGKNNRRSPRKDKYTKETQVSGIYDYTQNKETKSLLPLQNSPAFNKSLGARSRFGEGDGSFFDKWLNSDIAKTKTLYDKDGFPIMRFARGNIDTGFKRQLTDYRKSDSVEVNNRSRNRFLQSYAERREERLQREKALTTKSADMSKKDGSDSLPSLPETPVAEIRGDNDFAAIDIPSINNAELKLPDIVKFDSLSAAEKHNYFGSEARDGFFEYYRHLARQRFAVGNFADDEVEIDIEYMNFARDTDNSELAFDDMNYSPRETKNSARSNTARSRLTSRERTDSRRLLDEVFTAPSTGRYTADEEAFAAPSTGRYSVDDDGESFAAPSTGRRSVDNADSTFVPTGEDQEGNRAAVKYSRQQRRARSRGNDAEQERKLLLTHLDKHQQEAKKTGRPLSARSKFILACVNYGVFPQPSLIIRKSLTTTLNLSSLSIGNDLAVLLSDCLPALPALEGISIADNNLTDKGLTPIVKALSSCMSLRYFDMSHNKVDSETAEALRQYLTSDGCTIVRLIMQNANVDDYEASRFMKAVAKRQTVIEINLSQNLLGSHEFLIRKHDTAGTSIGELLSDPRCSLEKLIVAWNMIRFQSGVALCNSLKINQSLTYLDLSYNGLAIDGGEALGDALHSNQSLRVLKVAHNNISARPCCTILCGVITCKSIKELDLSENPIGEEGARSLLAVNLNHGQRVAIDIHGCSLRIRDKTCWFNSTEISETYSLNLEQPYDRFVCIELLRVLAHSAEVSIESFEYCPPGESIREIPLDIYTAQLTEINNEIKRQKSGLKRQKTGIADIANDIDQAREMFRRAANRIFKQYDMDDSGGLDRDEIAVLLSQLGLEGSMSIVDKLMTIYDTDGSGLIEEEEFISFLMDVKATQEQQDTWSRNDRYVYMKGGPMKKGKKEPEVYFPPDKGIMNIKLVIERTITGPSQVISQESVESMLQNSKGVTDSSALFEYALTVMKLNFGEAQTFFKVMLKEIGSVLQVIMKLLPRMATPADARMLISYVTNNDFEQQHHLRTAVGSVYRVYLGLPNGFYRLNLTEPTDKECLQRLLEINYRCASARRRADLGDTSQDGNNWYGFRNAVFDGQPIEVTKQWLERIPEKGKFEFDFVAMETISMSETEISNLKLFRLLVSLGMVTEDKRKRIFSRLKLDKEDGRIASKGSGTKRFEFGAHAMEESYAHSVEMYATYHKNRTARPEMEISKEELAYLHPNQQVTTTTGKRRSTEASVDSKATASGATEEDKNELNEDDVGDNDNNNIQNNTIQLSNEPIGDNNYNFIKEMMNDIHIDENIIATRIIEILENSLAGRYLTCVQLALILDRFPSGSYINNSFYTYRVELIIIFFSKIIDIINFDFIAKELTSIEYAMITFRLGWLNIWNPLKAEGYYLLNLNRYEEKQMIRMLMLLNYIESGDTWQESYYYKTSEPNAPKVENWKLDLSWFSEIGLPSEGVVAVHYFSGKGKGLLGCAPDPRCRMVLMSLVLSQPYLEDMWSEEKNTIENSDVLLASINSELSFRKEKQLELYQNGAKTTSRSIENNNSNN